MRPRPFVLAAASFALFAALPAAQSQNRPQTFRATTRLVQVSVVVHDDRQQPITGLRAEDFRVFEDGKEVPLAFFAARTPEAAPASPLVPEASGVFTNRIPSPANGGVVAIVFDQLNTSTQDQTYGRAHLLKFLESIDPRDRVALYVLTGDGLRILYDFSRDAESLVKALREVNPGDARALGVHQDPLSAALAADLSAFARGVLAQQEIYFGRLRADTTLAALEGIANRLAGVAGRKNLVWISGGFPFIEQTATGPSAAYVSPEVRRASRALNHADAAVYPIDARGLIVMGAAGNGQVATLANVHDPIQGLSTVADSTGGRLYYNTNDIGNAVTRATDDSRMTYMLGYYPVAEKWDSRFRRIEVKVRRPDVRVRHRAGYFAYPAAPSDAATRAQALTEAVKSPLEGTGVLMNVQARAEGPKVNLAIELDPGTVTLTHEAGTWTGGLDVAIVQTLPGEKRQREADFSLPIALNQAERDGPMTKGLRLTRTIELQPDTQQIRIVVRDIASGMVGSVFIDAQRLRKAAGARTAQ